MQRKTRANTGLREGSGIRFERRKRRPDQLGMRPIKVNLPLPPVVEARRVIVDVKESDSFFDIHYWCFTPSSFRLW